MIPEKKSFTPADDEEWIEPYHHTERVVCNEKTIICLETLDCDSTHLLIRNDNKANYLSLAAHRHNVWKVKTE